MPPHGKGNENHIFSEIQGDPLRWKCVVCSDASKDGRDILMLKSSVSGHWKSQAHQEALALLQVKDGPGGTHSAINRWPVTKDVEESGEMDVEAIAPTLMNDEPVQLSMAHQFMAKHAPDVGNKSAVLPNQHTNVFSDISFFENEWYDDNGNEISFAVDDRGDSEYQIECAIRQQLASHQWSNLESTLESIEDIMEDATISPLAMADDEEAEEDGVNTADTGVDAADDDPEWFPHGCKMTFYLDLLDNLPRLRLSDDQMKVILWVMKKCDTPNVPSFKGLRKRQEALGKGILTPKHHVSALGNHFHMNHPVDLIKLDWANPYVREEIQIYPEITDRISESWQADKWAKEVDESQLTPMWADWTNYSHWHFYTREVALLASNQYILPLRWVVYQGSEHCEAIFLSFDGGKTFTINDPEVKFVPCKELKRNYLDLIASLGEIIFDGLGSGVVALMPHPVHDVAKGRPAFCVRVMPWVDDVSGNRSKQYNAHLNIYLVNVSLPHQKLSQEYFVRFCSTSPVASALEQLDALAQDLQSQQWHEAYDCKLHEEIVFKVFGHLLAGDNPQQAELASTSGSKSRYWCRSDMSGGAKAERESDEGYCALYECADKRTVKGSAETLTKIIRTACLGIQDSVNKIQTESGTKDRIATHWIQQVIQMARNQQHLQITSQSTCDPRLNQRLQKEQRSEIISGIKSNIRMDLIQWVISQPAEQYNVLPPDSPLRQQLRPGDHFNILLGLEGVDPHSDTPCEILHTILLGIDKYLWYETSNGWKKNEENVFATRLQASSLDRLSLSSIRAPYMLQYKNSPVGRHFKALQQLGIFNITPELFKEKGRVNNDKYDKLLNIWRVTGELGALLWFPEIDNMEEYLGDLKLCIDNVLDAWGEYDPSRILYKFKLHILNHLLDDIRRFGPPILFATEVFKCWNSVFRLCSVLSNHQAPSKDIAYSLAGMEHFKHQVSGGWWKNGEGEYIRSGTGIRAVMSEDCKLRRRLGLNIPIKETPIRTVKPFAKAKQVLLPIQDLLRKFPNLEMSNPPTSHFDADLEAAKYWIECRYAISSSHDTCKPMSWVFYQLFAQSSPTPTIQAGQILQILSPTASGCSQGYILIKSFIVASEKESQFNMPALIEADATHFIPSKDILFIFNAQQVGGQASDPSSTPQSAPSFVINMHALHNAHLLRSTLPRSLTKPVALLTNRRERHLAFAAAVRSLKEPGGKTVPIQE